MRDPLLDLKGVAEHLGITHGSAQTYYGRSKANRKNGTPKPSDLPEPDHHVGKSPAWYLSTIEAARDHATPPPAEVVRLRELREQFDQMISHVSKLVASSDVDEQRVGRQVANAIDSVVCNVVQTVNSAIAK